MSADWEAADMVHRNRLGLAREAAAASTVDVGWVTSASPREIREMFANAIEDYRDATGLTGVGMNREATGADSG